MAKGNLIQGMGRGKLGDVVLFRRDGEQASRVYVKEVKNPKTTGQQAQRMIFATATKAYSILQQICNHSYEGVQYGAKSQQAFMKNALSMLRNRAAQNMGNFIIPNMDSCVANPYLISKGSLTSPENVSVFEGSCNVRFSVPSTTLDEVAYYSVADFCRTLGINKGDQVTIVALATVGNNPIADYEPYLYDRIAMGYLRVTVDANAADSDVVYSNGAWGSAVTVESNMPIIEEAEENDGFEILMAEGFFNEIVAYAVIRSAKVNNKWLRSTETMTVFKGGHDAAYPFNAILPAWQEGTVALDFENSRILNNAEQETIAASYELVNTVLVALDADNEYTTVENVAVVIKSFGQGGSILVIADSENRLYKFVDPTHVEPAAAFARPTNKVISVDEASELLGYTITVNN